MCITKECADPTEAGVYWREDDCWVRYSASTEHAIRDAHKNKISKGRASNVSLGRITSAKYPNGLDYQIDLERMEQVNLRSGYRREIKIIGKDPEDQAIEHAVEELLQLMNKESFLKKVVMEKHPEIKNVRLNTFLADKPDMYRQFVQALKETAKTNKELIMEMFCAVKQGDSSELKSLEYVFHGTPSENLESIKKNGLDAKLCGDTRKFWVGKDPYVSLQYCKTRARQATMALLLELRGHGETEWNTAKQRSIPNTKSSVLLPVAEIDLPVENHYDDDDDYYDDDD